MMSGTKVRCLLSQLLTSASHHGVAGVAASAGGSVSAYCVLLGTFGRWQLPYCQKLIDTPVGGSTR